MELPLSQYVPTYARLLIAAALIVVPIVLGSFCAKRLRMPDYGWKLGLIFFTFLFSLTILALGWPPKLGIEFRGGLNLIYEVDPAEKSNPNAKLSNADMDKMIGAITQRINPGGTEEIIVRRYEAEQIEILIPEVKEEGRAEQIEAKIVSAGALEFRILANDRDHKDLIERAKNEGRREILGKEPNEQGVHPVLAKWVMIKGSERFKDPERQEQAEKKIAELGELAASSLARDKKRVASLLTYPEIAHRIAAKDDDKECVQILVVIDAQNVTGQYLVDTSASTDKQGRPSVNFRFNSDGAAKFTALTGNNLPEQGGQFTRKLGILLDNELESAPSIQSTISDNGEITGEFTKDEVKDLVDVLNAGSLPAKLAKEPIDRQQSSATLGQDMIEKSAWAMTLAAVLVPLFMLWYYRFSGLAANVALILNMMTLLAIMIAVGARLTLTGLAGLALTVGMAVDNNVLVYERLREELERGATLRMGIRNAFQRASATIIDANLTTLIAATVLYIIGRDQLRGFAVALWLGVALSIFTSVFVSRVLFEIAERKRVLTEAKMLRVIGHTNIDFMGLFKYTAIASLLITIGGLIVAGIRGQSLFDIDFTGGVSVQALFKEPQDIGDVREKLRDALPDLAITSVRVADDPAGKDGVRFNVNTSEQDQGKVAQVMNAKFPGMLETNAIELVEKPTLIEAVAPPEKGKAAAKKEGEKTEDEKTEEKRTEEKKIEEKKIEVEKTKEPAKPDEAEKPKEADKTPAEKAEEQSRLDLPSDALIAMAGPSPFLFAGADEKTADQPADKTEEEPADKKTEEKTAAAKTEEKPVDAKTEEKPTVEEAKPAEAKTEAKPTAGTPDPFVGGTRARLKLAFGINHTRLSDSFTKAIKDCKLPRNTRFELSNEQYTEGSAKKYAEWNFKTDLPPDKTAVLLAEIQKQFESAPFFPASGKTSGQVAGSTQVRAFWALVLSWACMIVYLWVRFQNVAFGLAAVIALIHDVFVMIGAIALSMYVAPFLGFLGITPFKINMGIVAAILTIIGFSVNDTIVIFDRLREIRGKDPRVTGEMVNNCVNQTLSRTLLTSFTVLLVVVILYCFGGEELHGMAFALLVGVVTGTYSSVYVAAPILLWLIGRKSKKTQGQIV